MRIPAGENTDCPRRRRRTGKGAEHPGTGRKRNGWMKKECGVVFDLDGTLLNTLEDIADSKTAP